jgi:hypothetical protein
VSCGDAATMAANNARAISFCIMVFLWLLIDDGYLYLQKNFMAGEFAVSQCAHPPF